jgi:hypothetical protein
MDLFTALIIAAFFFIMGGVAIGLVWYLQSLSQRIKNRSKAAESDSNLAVVAALMRDKQSQELVVEMDGKPFKAAAELSPAQLRRLNFTSSVLVKWLAGSSQAAETAEQHSETSLEDTLAEPLPFADEEESIELHTTYVPPFAVEPGDELKPISTDLPDMVGNLLTPTPPPPTPQFKSIAMQINDILQEKIAGTPLENRGITVNDAPEHGVMVSLDGQKYPGVKDVPDEEVRNAIRAAVLEWETRK